MISVPLTLLARFKGFIAGRHWYDDLVQYYGVTPVKAEELAIRRAERRPDLPGSPTTHPVSGMTFEEIWALRDRSSPETIQQFYQDMGAWATFRQVYRHRYLDASRYVRGLPPEAKFCEYGSGVAPIAYWIVGHVRRPLTLTITDVPSEHFRFARWRLQKKIAAAHLPFRLLALEVIGDALPLTDVYDAIVISEVFEHLHNPLVVARHLVEHLIPGGRLWENYLVKEPEAADLKQAQEQRVEVFQYIHNACRLVDGSHPDHVPGDTRCWQKR